MSNPFSRRFWFAFVAVYVLSGLVGTAWISDEFDSLRIMAVSLFGLPLVGLAITYCALITRWWTKFFRLRLIGLSLILLIFGWGNLLLLNALGSESRQLLVARNFGKTTSLNVEQNRGAFGTIYQYRW